MLAVLEASLPAMNQQVVESAARARNAPPPAPSAPGSRKFLRVFVDATLDTDSDGSPDWAEFEIAARETANLPASFASFSGEPQNAPAPPAAGDPYNADTNGDDIPDGQQLDVDRDGTPDANDPDISDATAYVPLGPTPRYALFPLLNVPQYPLELSYRPIEINNKGTVLCPHDTWTAGVWTPLEKAGEGIMNSRAFGINDFGEIIGTCEQPHPGPPPYVPLPGNVAYWDSPEGVPSLIKQGGDYAWSPVFFGTENYYAGSKFSNDGSFFAFSEKVENGIMEGRTQNFLWTLSDHGHLPGKSAVASGYDQLLDRSHYWGLAGPPDAAVYTLHAGGREFTLAGNPGRLALMSNGTNLLSFKSSAGNADSMVAKAGSLIKTSAYAKAIDLSTDGIAIGRNHDNLNAPIYLNGRWTGIERTAPVETDVFAPPPPWHDGSVSLLDTTPGGWILAQRGFFYPYDYAVMLPIKPEGSHTRTAANQDGSHTTDTAAVGVDDFSIGSETPGTAVQDRIWIMAPQGGASKVVKFKAPLNSDTPLNLSASNILFDGQGSATANGPENPISLRAADNVLSGGERLMTLTLGSDNNEVSSVSKPIGVKIMKGRTVKVTVYKVTKLHGVATEQEVDELIMPTGKELEDHLNDVFRPQINTTFSVNLETVPLIVRWDANTNARFDLQTGLGAPGEEAAILASVPANPPAYDIRVFLVANNAALGSSSDAYGLTLRDQRTCWVLGSRVGKNRNKPYLLDTIAHEIGHVLVGEGHPDSKHTEARGKAPLPGTKHSCRLMCSGPNSDGSSRLLVKGEWDEAENWLNTVPDSRVFAETGNVGSY